MEPARRYPDRHEVNPSLKTARAPVSSVFEAQLGSSSVSRRTELRCPSKLGPGRATRGGGAFDKEVRNLGEDCFALRICLSVGYLLTCGEKYSEMGELSTRMSGIIGGRGCR